MNRYRWNEKEHVWEFFEHAFGGWTTLRLGASVHTRPMDFAEGFRYVVTNPMVRGREAESGWILQRIYEIGIEHLAQ